MKITPEQCRAARALLGWTQTDLANKMGFHTNHVWRFETSNWNNVVSKQFSVWAADEFKEAGISFSEDVEHLIIKRRKDV